MSCCKFSIVMPVYNAEKTVISSVSSVLNQTYKDFKLYIINDSSVDKTCCLLSEINDNRVIVLNLPENQGVSKARNHGIELSDSPYLAFIDSDDLWEPTKLEKQYQLLEQGHLVVCSNYLLFHADDVTNQRAIKKKKLFTYHDMLKRNQIGNLTGVYNQKVLGKFFQKNVGHEDYLMWLEIIKEAGQGICIQELLAKYRVREDSLSYNKFKAAKWQWSIYRNELHLGLLPSSYYWSNYAIRSLLSR